METAHFESLYPPSSRFHEIQILLNYIKAGNSCQIISLPGVGRSNLLGLLSYNRAVRVKHLGQKQKEFHFVYLNFSEVRQKPLVEATKFIFLSLVDSLRERKMQAEYEQVSAIFKESLSLADELVLFQGLKKTIDLLAIDSKLSIVLLFDRFEEYVPMLTPAFFTHLRILRNRAKYHFSVVFSLNRPLEDLLEPLMFADFYEFLAGHNVYLPTTDEPGLAFRLAYLAKSTGKVLDPKVIADIHKLTASHGKLTRVCIEATLNTPESFGDKLLDFLLRDKPVRGTLFEIWHFLRPEEQMLLSNEPIDSDFLTRIGLIKDGKIAIPLFSEFVKREITTAASDQALRYDPTLNAIFQGQTNLSDKLTAAEFRLLRFLLQNVDRVIDRDEVIAAVWQETKTTAGVTDQALDQLMFRLRKKIETDPNNPRHLQTVKGRGFRFAP